PTKMPHTRPTTDLAKEGLFNILQNRVEFEGMKTLDLFGGTGAISYELASRGAEHLTIIEKDPVMATFIRKTAADLKVENFNALQLAIFKFLASCNDTYDSVFAGPPYALTTMDEIPAIIHRAQLIANDGLF